MTKPIKLCLALLLLVIVLPACKKKELSHIEQVKAKNAGTLSAKLNGQHWANSVVLASWNPREPEKFDVAVICYDGVQESQTFSLNNLDIRITDTILYSIKTYILAQHPTLNDRDPDISYALFSNRQGDAVMNSYYVIEDSTINNYIKIDHYDAATQRVQGRFSVSLYKDSGHPVSGFPDTLSFTDGTFDLVIKN